MEKLRVYRLEKHDEHVPCEALETWRMYKSTEEQCRRHQIEIVPGWFQELIKDRYFFVTEWLKQAARQDVFKKVFGQFQESLLTWLTKQTMKHVPSQQYLVQALSAGAGRHQGLL